MIKIIKAAIINFRNEWAYRSAVKQTMNELHQLTDHDLGYWSITW